MKVLKKIWIYGIAPALMLWVSLYMIILLFGILLNINAVGVLIISILFLTVELLLCAGTFAAYVYSIVVAAKRGDTVPLILTIFLSAYYFPFYHRKIDGDSLAFPIISVVGTVLGYGAMLIGYILLLICAGSVA